MVKREFKERVSVLKGRGPGVDCQAQTPTLHQLSGLGRVAGLSVLPSLHLINGARISLTMWS